MSNLVQSIDIEIRVRYCEVDRMGAVHHSRYWIYFEMGRIELLRAQGIAYADLEQQGVFFVVAKCSARFLAPARYDDKLILSTRVVKTGAARIDNAYELKRMNGSGSAELLATGETTLACVNAEGRIIPIPDLLGSRKRIQQK